MTTTEGKRPRPETRPVTERHATHQATRRRMGLENTRGRTKLPPVLMDAYRAGKLTASHAVLWAVVDHCCALTRGRADAGHGSLGDAIGASRKKAARLLVDASPLFANLDGRGPLMAQEPQDEGLATWYRSRRKTNGQIAAWAPTWTLCLVCDSARHENLLPARLVSPDAWLLFGLLVWWSGDDGACWRTVPELAEALGCTTREAQRLMRELRTAGLLLVRDRRTSRDGAAKARPNVIIPVVDRAGKRAGGERPVVMLLRQLPAELPADLAWSLDLLEPAGSPGPGRVSFGGWAAWRALVATGPLPILPLTLAERFGVPEEDAARWSEEAAMAGLVTLDGEGVWTAVTSTEPPTPDLVYQQVSPVEEGDPDGDVMTTSLTHLMTTSLTQVNTTSLTHVMTTSLTHETSTPTRDPLHTGGLRPSGEVEVVEGEGMGLLPPPKADVVTGDARERPTAGPATPKPAPDTFARVTGDPAVHALLLERMTPGQRAQAAQLVAQALADPQERPTPERLAHRLTASLEGKSPADINSPFAWFRHRLRRRGCARDCTCPHPECEGGTLWPAMETCGHCDLESTDRLAAWRREHPEHALTVARQQPGEEPPAAPAPAATVPAQSRPTPRLRLVPVQPDHEPPTGPEQAAEESAAASPGPDPAAEWAAARAKTRRLKTDRVRRSNRYQPWCQAR